MRLINSIIQFRGGNNFSLNKVQQETYKNSYCRDIIPDLFEYMSKTGNLQESEIKGVLGHGGLSIIFDLGDEVLKGSLENPLEFREHNPSIDIPFLSDVEKVGKTYFVREAKADTKNVGINDCFNVLRRIRKSGLEPSMDLDVYKTEQIGKYQGRAYLLDTRCAVPRPNRFSRFVYDFKRFNMRVYRAISFSAEAIAKREVIEAKRLKSFGPQFLHVDESPRPNLSFKRGVAVMQGVMNRNRKYGLPPINILAVIECLLRAVIK